MKMTDLQLPPRTVPEKYKEIPQLASLPLIVGGLYIGGIAAISGVFAVVIPCAAAALVGLLIHVVLFGMKRSGWMFYDSLDLDFWRRLENNRLEATKAWAELSLMPAVQRINRISEPNLHGWHSEEVRQQYAVARERVRLVDALMLELNAESPTIDQLHVVDQLSSRYHTAAREIKTTIASVRSVTEQCQRLELPAAAQAKLAARELLADMPNRLRKLQVPVGVSAKVQTRPLGNLRPRQACGKHHF